MFEGIVNFFKRTNKKDALNPCSKEAAKERLHLVLMQDRANVSADFLDLMRQEIIEVIKKYIDIDESAMDVRLTNQANEDGTQGAPALYANIPILNIKEDRKNHKNEKVEEVNQKKVEQKEDKSKEKIENKGEIISNCSQESKSKEKCAEENKKAKEKSNDKQEGKSPKNEGKTGDNVDGDNSEKNNVKKECENE